MSATRTEILEAAHAIYGKHNAVFLATAGDPHSDFTPWVLGAYFASDGDDLVTLLEESGTTMRALRSNNKVALAISNGDAMQDFLQARGRAEILSASDDMRVRGLLQKKMPWFQTYTPCLPVRIRLDELRVSSFSRGWFPAQRAHFER
jgi:nitroimidazol reductase NimA-like FMN-containing flavoprotein (pyridoxamine 5'-phosphate oxidase superfamily)